jgi:hypothetical protein
MVAGTRGCVANAEYNEAVLQPHSAGANITGQLPNQTHQDKTHCRAFPIVERPHQSVLVCQLVESIIMMSVPGVGNPEEPASAFPQYVRTARLTMLIA